VPKESRGNSVHDLGGQNVNPICPRLALRRSLRPDIARQPSQLTKHDVLAIAHVDVKAEPVVVAGETGGWLSLNRATGNIEKL
jgi:hypothetical protein